jgi:hypothetical protein
MFTIFPLIIRTSGKFERETIRHSRLVTCLEGWEHEPLPDRQKKETAQRSRHPREQMDRLGRQLLEPHPVERAQVRRWRSQEDFLAVLDHVDARQRLGSS